MRNLTALDDSPQRIALGFAVGIFLAFSPLLGLHTFLGLLIAFLFGLNRVAVLVGVFINNPWTLLPIYGLATYIGGLLIGFPHAVPNPSLELSTVLQSRFWKGLAADPEFFKALLVGSAVLSTGCALISYPVTLFLVRKAQSK